jgi:hypothetical protein
MVYANAIFMYLQCSIIFFLYGTIRRYISSTRYRAFQRAILESNNNSIVEQQQQRQHRQKRENYLWH